jgi:hypothetical protein
VGAFCQVPPEQDVLANDKNSGKLINQRLFVHMLECVLAPRSFAQIEPQRLLWLG